MKTSRLPAIVLATFFLALVGAFSAPAEAATRIELVVNGKPITSYDLTQRSRLIVLTTRSSQSVAKRRARNELIEEALKMQEAERVGVSVSDADVNSAFGDIARRVRLSPSQFTQALGQNGINSKTLKDRLRSELAWRDVVMRRFRATVRINQSDVIAALRDRSQDTENTTVEYDLQRVIFVVPESASASKRRARQSEMNKLRSRFTSCSEGLRIAGGLKEVVVRPIGKRLENDLSPAMKKELDNISVGRLTKAQEIEQGYEMIALCDKRTLQSDAAARSEVEGELRNEEGQRLARRYLHELRTRAVIEDR
ncbi:MULTISPECIES: SurA N-terminal domain-containing protein [Pseudovibrio]|uniref:SurA N-terminal domain-containing protein n=1 Tax=Stappiaceae TaxID=2821832 RepID=UPI0023663237|nr:MULTISPECIES: SurA N-terminal domain-containing protein [Pseudovibrio]MDD7908905.1 SurA N-terminal domain-containing protein [Pseudovibrio exalbescens]MDX5593774.1 SurA N-terminal domain-containing protein [Pseudovibrio sp. SPO723]